MNGMKRFTYIIWMIVLSILLVLTIPYLWYIMKVIFIPKHEGFWGQEKIYAWIFVGIFVSLSLRMIIRSKSSFLETFSHESTHALVAFLFGRRVHSFHVEDSGSGMIFTSGNNNYSLIPVALAPYCLPIFTYFLLAFRCIVGEHFLWICDLCIGMTLCFHYYCFKTQIGNHQTDINQYPLSFSYFYILTAWIINICIILVALFPNMNEKKDIMGYGVFSSVMRLGVEWWNNLLLYIHWFQ